MDFDSLSPKSKWGVLSFISILVLLSMGTLFMIDNEIYPIHEWRKFDSLSFAINYAEGDSFASPSTQFINENGNRNAASEFPIVYYLFGTFWSLFGISILSTKLWGILFSLFSVFISSNVVFDLTKSFKKQLLFVAFFLLCPVYTFYFHSLIPNIYSLNFLLICSYLFYKYTKNSKPRYYILFSFFITLSILIKITSLIAILSFIGGATLYLFFVEKNLFSTYKKLGLMLLGTLAFALSCTFLWYTYAIEYNELHGSSLFSTTIRPLWEVESNKRWEIWKGIFNYQLNGLYHPFILICLIAIVSFRAFIDKLYFPLFFIGVSAIGITSYMTLWFWALQNHDYYLIELIYFPITLFTFLLIQLKEVGKRSLILYSFLGLFTFLSSATISQTSYGMQNFFTKESPFLTKHERGNKWWFHKNHKTHLGAFQDVVDEIKKLIPKDGRVFALSDPSPNGHLVLLKRKGYTGYAINQMQGSIIERLKNLGIQDGDVIILSLIHI